jgi:NAD(P)-dependent dehydrogenase (short-subunit alcohol dehydrogenase family)
VHQARALGVKSLAIRADSAEAKALTGAVERAAKELGGLDILVNNAGIAALAPLDEFPLEDFDHTVAVNLRAVFVGRPSEATSGWGKKPERNGRGAMHSHASVVGFREGLGPRGSWRRLARA